MTIVIVVMIVVTILGCWAKFYQSYLAEKSDVANTRLREDVFRRDVYAGGFLDGISDTTSRIIGGAYGKRLRSCSAALREPMIAVAALASAFYQLEAGVLFVGSAPMVVGVIAILGKKMKKASKKSRHLRPDAGPDTEAINAPGG
jgi:hypothetical protein